VHVEGKPRTRTWQDSRQRTVTPPQVIADIVQMLGSRDAPVAGKVRDKDPWEEEANTIATQSAERRGAFRTVGTRSTFRDGEKRHGATSMKRGADTSVVTP